MRTGSENECEREGERESEPAKIQTSVLSRENRISLQVFFHSSSLLVFLVCVGQNPKGGPRTSIADVASALLLPPLLNHGSNTLQMNKHLHPFSVKARRLLHSRIQQRKKERKKERYKWRVEEGAQEKDDRWKGGSMSE